MHGPGKYDAACSQAREATQAEGAILIVLGGRLGSGFSVQAPLPALMRMPELLEDLARQIQADLVRMGGRA